MLVQFVLYILGHATNVPAVTAAYGFIYDTASFKRRHGILLGSRLNGFGGQCHSKFSCSVAITYRSLDMLLEFERRIGNCEFE